MIGRLKYKSMLYKQTIHAIFYRFSVSSHTNALFRTLNFKIQSYLDFFQTLDHLISFYKSTILKQKGLQLEIINNFISETKHKENRKND